MNSTGGVNNASGGIWQTSRTNPTLTAACGLRVALILDLSGSVGSAITNLQTAAKTFVNSLVGTPSSVGLFTFATNGPANTTNDQNRPLTSVSTATGANSAATVNGWIDGTTVATGSAQFTNWDRAFNQVTQTAQQYDIAVIITDGNPTAYGSPATTQSDGRTRFRDVENGIFSANGLKAKGTRLVAFGVGAGVSSSGLNLQSISGQTINSDYYQTTNYDQAGAALKALAQGSCQGSVSVIKQVIPPGGTTANATPAPGWTFGATTTASGVTIAPGSAITDATGGVNFALTFPGGTTTAPVTVTETQQAGYTLFPQGTSNATCLNISTGLSVPTTNSGALGFQLTAAIDAPISCTVYNQAPAPPATVQVDKVWNVNGTLFPNLTQPTGLVSQPTINGNTGVFGVVVPGFTQGEPVAISETPPTLLPLCTLTGSTVTLANGTTVNAGLPFNATLVAGANTYTITNVITCTSNLQLTKTVVGGTALPTAWNLQAIAPNGALVGPSGTTGVTANVTPGVVYALAESGGDLNYVQDLAPNAVLVPGSTGSWTCIEVDATGNQIPGFSDGLNGGVTVPLGQRIRCTATNRTVDLVLRKVVTNSFGGTATPSNWNLTVTPTGTPPPGLLAQTVTGTSVGTTIQVRPGQNYALTESGGPPGYQLQSIDCNGIQETSVTPQVGQTTVCTFTNRDVQPTLTLVKSVTNDNGGTASPTAWTLTATGPTPISGVTGSAEVTGAPVTAGTYTLSETGPAGYTPGAWTCSAGTLTGSSLVLPVGVNATCTIVNDDQPAHLTLVKTVTNNNGGTAVPTDWKLVAAGPTPISGSTGSDFVTNVPVSAGAYTLSEADGPAGYTPGAWTCDAGILTGAVLVLPNGVSATCTINNDDQPATLTLVKTLTNDNGGTAVPTAWTLAAAGPTTISGVTGSAAVTGAPVSAGTYTLSEAGPSGYTPGAWACTAGTLTGSSLVLPNGVSATCTINNDDQPAHLTLVKTVTNDNGGTAAPIDWTLTATGPITISGVTGSTAITNAAVPADAYTLTESGGPGGYTPGTWTCDAGILTGAVLTLPNGVSATCTINNDDVAARLTLVKTVTNDNGGTAVPTSWTLTATGPTTISGATGSAAVTNALVDAGTYVLSESGPSGYTAGAWSCDAGTLTGSSLVLPNGVSATCTIANDDQPGTLTLVKTVTNDNGGTAVATDWTLTATGPTTISGVTGSVTVTGAPVSAGTYVLSESGPSGYTAGAWSCDAGTLTGSSLVLPNGVGATCTINNDDQPATLTLVKTVTNDNGGTAVATDWTLTATGPTSISGVTGSAAVTAVEVNAGTYILSESGPPGYFASGWSCTAGTLNGSSLVLLNGVNATCTINNNDLRAHLTLVKTVTNDDGGTALPTDWTLTATGPTTISGATGSAAVTAVEVNAGPYILSESGPSGYTAGSWACDGGSLTGDALVLNVGQTATCMINNDDQAASLTLVKTVTNDNGGTELDSAWMLTATGPTTVSGVTGSAAVTSAPVDAGTYTLSESGPSGYTAGAWSCTIGETQVSGSEIALGSGESATCTINNDDQPATLTLVKTVTNDNGGTALPTEWTLTATGPTTISGATGSTAVTNAPVDAGTYVLSEASGPPNYIQGDWSCTAGTLTGSSLLLPNGVSATCTIVNDDEAGTWTIEKTAAPTSGSVVEPGSTITYTVGLTKTGGVDPTNLTVTDDLTNVLLHADIDQPGITASLGDATFNNGRITWTIPNLPDPPDASSPSATLTYTVTVNADAYGATLINVVAGTSSTGPPLDCAPAPVPVAQVAAAAVNAAADPVDPCSTTHTTPPSPTWTLAKSSDPATGSVVQPGTTITYTVTATKTSAGVDPKGLLVTDDLTDVLAHASFDLASIKASTGTEASFAGGKLTWSIPDLSDPVGSSPSAMVTYSVTVNSDAFDATLTNAITGIATSGPPSDCMATAPSTAAAVAVGGATVVLAAADADAACSTTHTTGPAPTTTTAPPSVESATTVPPARQPDSGLAFTGTRAGDLISLGVILFGLGLGLLAIRRRGRALR
jgi:fimbrial isopeptide formation D2 family protein